MRIFHLVSRSIAWSALAFVFAMAAIAVVAAAQTPDTCPPIIATLLPKNGSVRDGQCVKGGEGNEIMITGSGSADIPFEHPCIKSVKFPARVSIEIWYFGGEMVMLFEMQGDAPNEEILSSATREFVQHKNTLDSTLSEPKREKLAGGEIVYADFKSECPSKEAVMADVGEMIVPNVMLTGVACTANARLRVSVKGQISVDAAKAAVTEVFENFKRADFSKVK
jgi:hypothetical protein